MKTLNLTEAAQFLKLHPEEVRRRAKAGIIPSAKLGKRWAFIENDLADHIRSLYACTQQALQVGHDRQARFRLDPQTRKQRTTTNHRQ